MFCLRFQSRPKLLQSRTWEPSPRPLIDIIMFGKMNIPSFDKNGLSNLVCFPVAQEPPGAPSAAALIEANAALKVETCLCMLPVWPICLLLAKHYLTNNV